MTIDIDKLKVWLKLKSKECGNADETDDWSWGNKFAFDYVYDILSKQDDYDDMVATVDSKTKTEY